MKELLQQLEVGNYRSLLLPGEGGSTQEQTLSLPADGHLDELVGDKSLLQAAPVPITDVLIVADVLKIWFRKMPEPITTFALYDMCIAAGTKNDERLALVSHYLCIHKLSLRFITFCNVVCMYDVV